MKTVKEVSAITGISIRTLRYYDEIGLLKPTHLTDAKYRLYDDKAFEKLQQIMFFRELEIPLLDIKTMMEDSSYDREQALITQKLLLENRVNRLNGIIELINDVQKGVNTMSFEAFTEHEVQKIIDHMLTHMSKENLNIQIDTYGTLEKYREFLAAGFENKQAVSDVLKWYGSKEKALEAVYQSDGNVEIIENKQDENDKIYKLFMQAKATKDTDLAKDCVTKLAKLYKSLFQLNNARALLLDLAKEYLQGDKLAEANDSIYGKGSAAYIGLAIKQYYGEL